MFKMFESSIYTAMILATCIGVPVSSGATDGKNCTKTITYRTIYKTTLRPVYKDFPVCCPSFIEINSTCIKETTHIKSVSSSSCQAGKYGENCTNNCTCPKNAIDGCEKDTGNCTCVTGKQGEDCHEDCDDGHYGPQCIKTCSCLNNSTCSPVDGYCNCTAGYTGRNCEKKCNEGWYGLNCSFTCNCTSSQTCNPVSGDCTCKPGRQGQDCEQECSNFTFGSNCAYVCDCINETTQICNTSDGTCICKPGWEGTHCHYTCRSDTFGENCKSVCNCSSNYFCEPASGMCLSDCVCKQPGTSNCDDTRIPCNCSDEMKHGACNAATRTTVAQIRTFMTTVCICKIEDSFCVPKNQSCYCKDGWTGNQCELEINLTSVSTDVVPSQKRSNSSDSIVGGVAGGLGGFIIVLVVVFFIKRRRSTSHDNPAMMYETPGASTNRHYSSPNILRNENDRTHKFNTQQIVAIKAPNSADEACGPQYDDASSGAQYDDASSGVQYDDASSGVQYDDASSGVQYDDASSGVQYKDDSESLYETVEDLQNEFVC